MTPTLTFVSLRQLRGARRLTQEDVAPAMETTQSAVSRIERQHDVKVSTLDAYVTATGGRLRLVAEYPDAEYEVFFA
jgi:transcriptional regulator with XRE-family HTH domain